MASMMLLLYGSLSVMVCLHLSGTIVFDDVLAKYKLAPEFGRFFFFFLTGICLLKACA